MFKSETQKHQERLDEELLFALAAHEIASGTISAGLYAKAVAYCNGDEQLAKARYLKLRVEMMKSERAAFDEQARLAESQIESQRQSTSNASQEISRPRLNVVVRVLAVLLGFLLAFSPLFALFDGRLESGLLLGIPFGVWLAYCGIKGESFNPFSGRPE